MLVAYQHPEEFISGLNTVTAFKRSLAHELGEQEDRNNCINPGATLVCM